MCKIRELCDLCVWVNISTMNFYLLSQAPLFKGMTPDTVESVLSETQYRTKKYQSGSMIFQSGETVTSLIIVASGAVSAIMTDYSGRVIKMEDIPAPGALASAFIFGKSNRFPVNVLAASDTELLLIGKSDFLGLLMKHDVLLVNFLDLISSRSQFLSEKIKFLNFKTLRGKLAFYILQKAEPDGIVVNLTVTQNDLADFFGVARPSVARVLRELENDGYLKARGKNIRIIDKERLADLTSD